MLGVGHDSFKLATYSSNRLIPGFVTRPQRLRTVVMKPFEDINKTRLLQQ